MPSRPVLPSLPTESIRRVYLPLKLGWDQVKAKLLSEGLLTEPMTSVEPPSEIDDRVRLATEVGSSTLKRIVTGKLLKSRVVPGAGEVQVMPMLLGAAVMLIGMVMLPKLPTSSVARAVKLWKPGVMELGMLMAPVKG